MNDNLERVDDVLADDALTAWAERGGFERPATRRPALRYRAMCWQLVATVTLALSTLLAATVLTLGYARADTLTLANTDGASLALAALIGFVLVVMGGLTALTARMSQD